MAPKKDQCCVPRCSESGDLHQTLHGFPDPAKDRKRFNEWVYAIGGEILALDNNYIYKNRKVCRRHFIDKHLCRFNRLSNIAVPTLYLINPLKLPSESQIKHSTSITTCSATGSKRNINDTLWLPSDSSNLPCKPLQLNCSPTIKSDIPPSKGKKNRVIKIKKSEKVLFNKLITLKRNLDRAKTKIHQQKIKIKVLKNITSHPEFLRIMENWTTSAKILTVLQIREHKKKSKGRRFTEHEKVLALTILKKSPKAYRFLRKIFILPSCQTLSKLLSNCRLEPGINNILFAHLKRKADKMKETDKLCVLLIDEMQLKAGLSYCEKTDRIIGLANDGLSTRKILADHAQVFMIRGLVKNFKQPIMYTFSSGPTKGPSLAQQIKIVIEKIHEIGFTVVATICDQATNNRHAIKILTEETHRKFLLENPGEEQRYTYFNVGNLNVIPLFDPPHLLKCMRNNLITKNLIYIIGGKSGVAKWKHLELLLKENPSFNGIRLIPTLSETHIIPSKIPRMRVKYASQIFSKKISMNMGYLAGKNIIPEECVETAHFLNFMDDLFDSVNGSYRKNYHAKPLLGPVTINSPHKKMWLEAIRGIKTFKFLNKITKKTESIPTLNGWLFTLEGILNLINKLENEHNVTSVWMRHINQDALENFFGAIRGHGCNNKNPTCSQFEASFTTLLINNIASSNAPGSNSEKDFADVLCALYIEKPPVCEENIEINLEDFMYEDVTFLQPNSDPRESAVLEYISGYFIKITKKITKSCITCKNVLCSRSPKYYISQREFGKKNWLQSPSDKFVKTISEMRDICYRILKTHTDRSHLQKYLILLITTLVDLKYIDCIEHKEDFKKFLINRVTRFFVYTYCKNINNVIYGKRNIDDSTDEVQFLARTYFLKHVRR